jgi:hypothetical protein
MDNPVEEARRLEWQFQRRDGTWCTVDRELEEAVLHQAELRDYHAGEWNGENATYRRQYREAWFCHALVWMASRLAGLLAIYELALAYLWPESEYLLRGLLGIPALIVLWQGIRGLGEVMRADPLPMPPG